MSATTVGIAFPASTPSKDVPASSSQIDSLSQREAAFSALQDATMKGKPGQKEELLTELNRTFAAYVGPNRVDDSVFAADRRIVTRTQRDAPDVAEGIADADERLARIALADAEAAHDELSADSNVTYDEASVERELSRARTALANGGDTPVARVQRYRRAWQHAQTALDTMDQAVTPRVSITTRADPRHAESITYRLNGTVTDVRTFEVRTVTVTVADGTAKTVELERGPAPFATGTFNTTLTLDKPVNEITVDATDENAHLGAHERGAKGNRGNGGAGSDEERPPSTGSDTLLLDADGLPDGYERSVVGTSPLDTDSDAPATNVSEADDGIVDGAEDFDGDALATRIEQNVSTDPFDVDTDDDALTDLFEHRFATVDPLRRDTDGDGVPDGREDPDDEGLVNVGEQRYGTLPLDPDTDADNLTDYYEVDTTKTNPLVPDSDSGVTVPDESGDGVVDGSEDFDGDGLANAMEFAAGTNPFDPDTDDDGLRDGFEQAYDTLSPLTNDTDGDGTLDAAEDPDGEGLVNVDEQAAGTSPVDPDTDGDTLTDAFEVERSLTSPLAVDSDSAGTNASEGDDGITDDAEDLENDSLTNAREQELDTDPLLADTDRDGLTDAYEVRTTKTDPLSNVSDSSVTNADESTNDVPDGLEDFDADQVESHYEEVFGTDPFDADTDGDGVTDGFEVRFSVLNPLSEDSDGDGVGDAREDGDPSGRARRSTRTRTRRTRTATASRTAGRSTGRRRTTTGRTQGWTATRPRSTVTGTG